MSMNQLDNMPRSISLFFVLFVAFLTVNSVFISAFAVEVKDLYQASAVVESQLKKDRKKSIQQAMKNMLVKVSGQQKIASKPMFYQAISKPDNYFLQYRYETAEQQSRLVVDFDENKVNDLFKRAQEPIWGRLRPQVLVWIVQESNFQRELVGSISGSNYIDVIKSFSKQRGLPLIMPLGDLDDITAITVPEIWGRFSEQIALASSRYQAEKVIVVRIAKHNFSDNDNTSGQTDCAPLCQQEQFIIDWSLLAEPQIFSSNYQGIDANSLLQQVVNDIADNIYQQYALSPSTNNEVMIEINNIASLERYVEVSEFLSGLSSVQSVMLSSVNGDQYKFKLNILGTKASLLASLKLSKQMARKVDPLAQQTDDDIPQFLWQR